MSEVFETRCHVWDVDWQTPEDDSFPCATFIIIIQATFTTAVSYDGDDEDEEEEDGDEPSVVIETTHEVRFEHLMNNNSSVTVRDMLVSLNIPVQDFMVEQILACAHRMRMTERYRNRKVLRMCVEIEDIVDELPYNEEDEHSNSMMNDNESKTVLEKLRKVVVEKPNSCCAICLEDFLVGTVATSMPACSHVFHLPCIISWLYKKKLCPLCRSEFN